MQSSDSKLARSRLQRALCRYSAVVQDMEQTVMLPSLLREVLCEEGTHCGEDEGPGGDVFECYLTLKSIRAVVESGLLPADEHRVKTSHDPGRNRKPLLDADPKTAFIFHLEGLLSVISCLTEKAQAVTAKYMEIVGIAT